MKKSLFVLFALFFCAGLFAQSDEEFSGVSEDELFGLSEDDLFGSSDDDFFFDDGIEEMVVTTDARTSELSHGALFENGSIKIGGTFNTSVGINTKIWAEDSSEFSDNLKATTLTPTASAMLTLDARPTQTLRMYTKFGLAYPFASSAVSTATTTEAEDFFGKTYYTTNVSTSITDYIKVKELFTDFSTADRAFFRFGLHTVTWGTGYFFSPVSDIVNSSSIDPENTTTQVDGCFNLRTQITFPGTQNCLWLYVIPDGVSLASNTVDFIDTAAAGTVDLVFGGWEIGLGGYYKYQHAPKVMVTATGSLKKMSFFSEFVYSYGAASEWAYTPDDWSGKTNIFQATAGATYIWKEPKITLAAQYYYNGYNSEKKLDMSTISDYAKFTGDMTNIYFTKGHNFALAANFGRIFGTSNLTATVFAMGNYGKEEIPAILKNYITGSGLSAVYLSTGTFSAMLNYSPFSNFTVSAGPYITVQDWKEKPRVDLKINLTLGGGKF